MSRTIVTGGSSVAARRRRARLDSGVALAVLTGSTAVVRSGRVPKAERAVFRSLNGLPLALHPPAYVVMQAGSLASVLMSAGAVQWSGRRRLARTVALVGVGVWAGAKAVKRLVGRGRPASHLDGVVVRGGEEGGLGFPSGHAAVAFCLVELVGLELPPGLRPLVWTVAVMVGGARVYVGAHLPLDVVGGAALGIAVGAMCRVTGCRSPA